MIDPRRYARVMGYSHGQATGHSRRAAHRQATGGQATAMQGRFRHAADLASRAARLHAPRRPPEKAARGGARDKTRRDNSRVSLLVGWITM